MRSSSWWAVLQKIPEKRDGREASLLFSLGSYSKQAGDERGLSRNVPLCHSLELSFADHVHHFVPLYRSPSCFKRKEAHPGFDQPFDEAVVLLHQVIEVFDLPEFDTLGKYSGGFQACNGLGIGRIFIDIDHTGSRWGGVGVSRSRRLGLSWLLGLSVLLPSTSDLLKDPCFPYG
jgi:hypothetical protein